MACWVRLALQKMLVGGCYARGRYVSLVLGDPRESWGRGRWGERVGSAFGIYSSSRKTKVVGGSI